uniref:NADH-ubiquinone oxidoreductase chain 3 n=1 Tax=Hypothenemus sp. BMNH 1039837 TaxID=1903764 RepID=A0A343A5M8_9CUCU|nr:NADH dehydrogenase subunit 3 [Hypothenemus sp. BMNH 1039837]
MLVSSSITASLITVMLMIILNICSKKMINDREKASPFECGFDPKNFARMPFSIHFFLIAIIFIIFDIELTLLLPLVMIMKTSSPITLAICSLMFIMTMMVGLLHEMKQGSLNWTI